MVFFAIDADLTNADWTKRTWDLPFEYGSEEFLAWLAASGMTLAQFKRLPVYRFAVERGEIEEGP